MAREITGKIYAIKGHDGTTHFVECTSLDDLFRYTIEEWLQKGYPIKGVTEITGNGSTPRVALYTNKRFKEIKSQYER